MSGSRGHVSGALGSTAVAALGAITRIEREGVEHFEEFRRRGVPVVFVFWHGHLLPLVRVHRHEGIVVLVSEHDDGEHIARIVSRNGFGVVRGSSTRGGTTGLRGLVRALRAGRDVAITPDGPRGPRGAFKPGALLVAQLTGSPVVPIALAASSAWRLSSWDGFTVPKPLSTVRIEYLAPCFVDRVASRAALEHTACGIGDALDAAVTRLERSFSGRGTASRRGTA